MAAPKGNTNRKGKTSGKGCNITLSIPADEYEIFQEILRYEGTEVTPEGTRERIRWVAKRAIKAEEGRFLQTLLLNEQVKREVHESSHRPS